MDIQGQPSWTTTEVEVAERHDLVLAARSIIASRRIFDAVMPPGFTGDPALIILLDLFVEQEEGRGRALRDLVAETGLSSPTIARWCKALDQEGLVRFGLAIELTDRGGRLVTEMIASVIAARARLFGMPPIR